MIINELIDTATLEKVTDAVGESLSLPVEAVTALDRYDAVFAVRTPAADYLFKIFNSPNWPEKEQLLWVRKQLDAYGVPHARLLTLVESTPAFPHGYMITTFLDGLDGFRAIHSGRCTFMGLHEALAHRLYTVHRIPAPSFGSVQKPFPDFLSFVMHEVHKSLRQVNSSINADLLPAVVERLTTDLAPYNAALRPVVVHGDPGPNNCLVPPPGANGDGECHGLTLVDWQDSLWNIWVADYAMLTYWGSHMKEMGTLRERQAMIRSAFFRGYGETALGPDDILHLETILHIVQATRLLPYFRYNQNSIGNFRLTLDRLYSLLAL